MQFRDITPDQFSLILAKLSDVEHHVGAIHTVSGQHVDYGMTVLARDGSHCMALVDHAHHLDGLLADRSSEDAAPGTEAIRPEASNRGGAKTSGAG